MVAVVHPCGDLLTLNPHAHALAPRGGWAPDGSWVPVPFVDERCAGRDPELATHVPNNEIDGLTPTERQARRRAWARLIKLVYEVNPLLCARCGTEMRVLAVITQPQVIDRILDHLASKGIVPARGPPEGLAVLAVASG
jgi:hypothetical protein